MPPLRQGLEAQGFMSQRRLPETLVGTVVSPVALDMMAWGKGRRGGGGRGGGGWVGEE